MSIGTRTTYEAERTPVAGARDTLSIGVAMRLAYIGVCLFAMGLVALVAGGISVATALVLVVCGGGVSFVSVRFVARWIAAGPSTPEVNAPSSASHSARRPVYSIE